MAYFTVQRELVDPDYHDGVVRSMNLKLVLQNLIGRIKGRPVDINQTVQVEAFPDAYDAAVAEGASYDKTGAATYTDYTVSYTLQLFQSKGYQVSRLRQLLPGHNDKNTLATKRARDARNLMLSVEKALHGCNEAVAYVSATKKPYTRGMGNWLKAKNGITDTATLHPVQPFSSNDIAPATEFVGNVTAGLTQEVFGQMLIDSMKQRGDGDLSLVGLCGIDLKRHISNFLGAATGALIANTKRTQPTDNRKLMLVCDDIEIDGCTVHLMADNSVANDTEIVPDWAPAYSASATYAVGDVVKNGTKCYVCKTAITTGESFTASKWTEKTTATWKPTVQSYKSGYFIDPTMWGIQTLSPLTDFPTEGNDDLTGGRHETYLRLACLNPMGQFRVIHTGA